ncbi:ferritin-like domain-containing protein [Streptomonospora algeriensis]|uniref:Ferritin-like domain-containing protein n=1 Tax=Streptomonospora algeriensis TaxID=995084 RepID=A0ABW3BF92_9ACTN
MTATPEDAQTATPDAGTETGTVAALQAALRAEHAAVYAYTYIGARSEDERRDRCYEHLDAHRAQRDMLRIEIGDRGTKPDAGDAAYDLPESDSGSDLDGYARRVERQAAQAYLELAAAPNTAVRDLALRSLQDTTLRSMEWGGELGTFPGFPGGSPPAQVQADS